jgi:hypothetical protein
VEAQMALCFLYAASYHSESFTKACFGGMGVSGSTMHLMAPFEPERRPG